MYWIKLTLANDGSPVYLNLAEVGMMQPEHSKGTHIFTKRTGPVHVRQTVEQILKAEKLND